MEGLEDGLVEQSPEEVIPRLGEMIFPCSGVPVDPPVVNSVGMEILVVVEFVWELAVDVWSEPILGLLALIPIGAMMES